MRKSLSTKLIFILTFTCIAATALLIYYAWNKYAIKSEVTYTHTIYDILNENPKHHDLQYFDFLSFLINGEEDVSDQNQIEEPLQAVLYKKFTGGAHYLVEAGRQLYHDTCY